MTLSVPLLGSRLPLVAAPMAGGPTTVALAAAVATAGGFPFLAGGYKTPEALSAEIEELRGTGLPFGVNLFVPAVSVIDAAAFGAYVAELQADADRYGLQLDAVAVQDDDRWQDKVALLRKHRVPVVSFTFGLPSPQVIASLHEAGSQVLATVTTPSEAATARDYGVDGLTVQGPCAGGHSATHDPARDITPMETEELVRQVRAVTELPIIAAGGVDGPDAVHRLREAGADAVAVGTLLLRTDEAGTSPTHRAALADPAFTETIITRAFTGRPARALRNTFIDQHGPTAPVAYPALHHLTRPIRQAAAAAGDASLLHLWAGTGYRSAPAGPAADVIESLAEGL